MDRGLYVAASGAVNHSRELEVISNNLAGGNTVGFKKDLSVFDVYRSENIQPDYAGGIKEKAFVNLAEVSPDYSQGVLKATGNKLDVSISGEGFFVVETDNGRMYTRKGDFAVDSEGRLTTKDGRIIEGEAGVITLTPGQISIERDGNISVDGNNVGKLKVVNFTKPYQLAKVGEGMFQTTSPDVGEQPGDDYDVVQGQLEMSNVNSVNEMVSMISALRAYESQMKLIKGFDDITQSVIVAAGS